FGGTHETHLLYVIVCFFVSLLGIGVRAITIAFVPAMTSGRNTKKQVADTVNKTGIYSIFRHPLYIGNFLIFLGIVLVLKSLSFTLIFVLFYWFYYERIIFAEEYFMRNKFKEQYLNWAAQTPIFFPNFSNFKKPELPFSFKNILKREYPSLAGAVFVFLLYDIGIVYINEFMGSSESFLKAIKPIHFYIFYIDLAFYAIVRVLVKATRLLEVEGR
ncbi:MAG: lipid A Kdo2 1-phosphate O-methyltransferase, partial [Leptospiraceae bacterium]|nr:lipid A Kdo2 1-phosphate O-methyltransferase [Leptospiraceae bacterium]